VSTCECDICDFCIHYAFNGLDGNNSIYTGDGRCLHPEHPGPRDPSDGCPDFECSICPILDQTVEVIRED